MYDYCIILSSFYFLTVHKKLIEKLMIHRMGIVIGIDLINFGTRIGIGLAIPFKFWEWIGNRIDEILKPITHLWFKMCNKFPLKAT